MTSDNTIGPGSDSSSPHVATSVHLASMLDKAGDDHVTVNWLIEQLGERSFGLTLLVMALLGLVPGASTFVGVLVAWPAIQMILGHKTPVLPGFFGRRKISLEKLERAVRFVTPKLRWVETMIKPRWPAGFQATRRLTGIVVLLLGLTLISPFPFSQVLPALVIMLLALAYLEEDGSALLVISAVSLVSLALSAATVWGIIETADWIDPASPT